MFRKLRETETLANELLEFGKTQWIQDNNFVQVELKKNENMKSTNLFKALSNMLKYTFANKDEKEEFYSYTLSVVLNHRIIFTKYFYTKDNSFIELENTIDEIVECVSNTEANHTEFNNKLLEYMKKLNEGKFDPMFSLIDLQLVHNNLDYTYKNVEPLLRVLYVFHKFEKITNHEKEKYSNIIVQTVKDGIISELEKIDNIRSLEVDSALNRLKELVDKEK